MKYKLLISAVKMTDRPGSILVSGQCYHVPDQPTPGIPFVGYQAAGQIADLPVPAEWLADLRHALGSKSCGFDVTISPCRS